MKEQITHYDDIVKICKLANDTTVDAPTRVARVRDYCVQSLLDWNQNHHIVSPEQIKEEAEKAIDYMRENVPFEYAEDSDGYYFGKDWQKAKDEYLAVLTAHPPQHTQEAIDFAEWLADNTEISREPKITLYRYCDNYNQWGNYTLEDIYSVFKEKYEPQHTE